VQTQNPRKSKCDKKWKSHGITNRMRSTKESTNQSVLLGCIYGGGFLHNYPMIAIFMYSPLTMHQFMPPEKHVDGTQRMVSIL
jgi:hypothetical protein